MKVSSWGKPRWQMHLYAVLFNMLSTRFPSSRNSPDASNASQLLLCLVLPSFGWPTSSSLLLMKTLLPSKFSSGTGLGITSDLFFLSAMAWVQSRESIPIGAESRMVATRAWEREECGDISWRDISFSYARQTCSGDVMYNSLTIANSTVLCTLNLLGEQILSILSTAPHLTPPPHTRTLYEGMDTLISLIVLILSQCILDHQVVNLKYIYIISNCHLDFSKAGSKM